MLAFRGFGPYPLLLRYATIETCTINITPAAVMIETNGCFLIELIIWGEKLKTDNHPFLSHFRDPAKRVTNSALSWAPLGYHGYSTLEYPITEYSLIGMRKSIHTEERAVFVKRLKKARMDAGFTQAEAADKLGCSQSWVSKIELGELRVEAIWLNRLAKLYGKSVNYFL